MGKSNPITHADDVTPSGFNKQGVEIINSERDHKVATSRSFIMVTSTSVIMANSNIIIVIGNVVSSYNVSSNATKVYFININI